MATHLTKETIQESRAIMEDGGELLGGLLAKAVVFFDAEGQARAAHCEIDRLRPWTTALLNKPTRLLPESVRELIETALLPGSNHQVQDIVIPSSTGLLESFHVSCAPIHGKGDIVTGVTLAIYDASTVQELGQNLGQMVRLASIGLLSASLAHEIKNAMVAVNTFVDILATRNSDAELAPIVKREVRRIDSIVGQMLRVSAPKKPHFRVVKVHELLEHALSVADHRMAGNNIRVERKLDGDPDTIMGDESQLEQAFVNLFFNAVEAMGSHGKLTVSTAIDHNSDGHPILRVLIQDTGMGIPADLLPEIFDPFFTTKTSGHGLGLPITRRIILEHRGEIEVQSQVGEGTTFAISLPSTARQP